MFSIVIPLLNEEANIINLVDEINVKLDKYNDFEIILINDGSTDKTYNIINTINSKKIKIINNLKTKGQSYSISQGIKKSINKIIVTIDGDGQNDPSDIPNLLKFFLKHDEVKLVGGIRSNRKDNIIKITSSKIANFVRSRILKDGCKDTGCSLKIFDKEIFLSFPFFDGIHRFLPALFKGYGYKTNFLNVNHRKRKHGKSKYGTINRLINGIKDMNKVRRILKHKN